MPTLRMSSRHTHRLLPALHGEGVLNLLSGFATCPGLFYATPAADGILSRIRIPGGIISSQQCRAIADIAEQHGGGYIDVTNRANLQVREIRTGINAEVLKYLQDMGLGSGNTVVDQIRNIMTSPTAGIDPQELIDTRPFVQSWDDYIAAHPALSGLSAKFSVCFDGGGIIQVCDRLNDIAFAAVLIDDNVYFRLYLSVGEKGQPPSDTGILLPPEQCLPVLAALADVYLAHSNTTSKRRLRLRELLNTLGCENYLQEVEQCLPFPLLFSEKRKDLTPHQDKLRCTHKSETVYSSEFKRKFYPSLTLPLERGGNCISSFPPFQGGIKGGNSTCVYTVDQGKGEKYQHIGIHPQRQQGLFYIGVVLPLGRLENRQMRGLADLAAKYGSGTLRLTPWQNLLLTDIPQQWVADVQNEIAFLGLDSSATNIKSALVACSGKKGCASSATDTKSHALTLAEYLKTRVTLDCSVNIHFTGCEKSCAQHGKSDITLLGVSIEAENGTVEGYHVYVGDSKYKFGRELYQYVTFAELPALIERMLYVYKIRRLNSDESFGKFANRYALTQLQQLFNIIPQSFVNNKIPNFLEKSAI
ncbi:precorrin-3B synthase [Nostoc edaphicum CCNP1411]|uniref:Precorrin-3B synthase n=1 Tax=Nostoc edaphicum CCNP1411 TaxID=1472755 RepID=A0A7D7LGY4_9NOSO|nr:precorrin-3B synthase [Nostoc edaphicum]QMS91390.1 precorrin-3B synthase [Nostoc edaphicum CCNP1411]